MKPRNASSPLILTLAATLAISSAFAQSQPQVSSQNDEYTQTADVAVARCAYTPGDAACAEVSSSRQESSAVDLTADSVAENNRLVAQYPRGGRPGPSRRAGPPMRRPMGYGRPYGRPYGGPWFHEGNPGHAVIGALILGGIGATLAANTHPNGQRGPNVVGALFCGGLGLALGAVIGNDIPFDHSRFHRNPWPEDDEDAKRMKPAAADSTRQTASAQPHMPESSSVSSPGAPSPSPGAGQ